MTSRSRSNHIAYNSALADGASYRSKYAVSSRRVQASERAYSCCIHVSAATMSIEGRSRLIAGHLVYSSAPRPAAPLILFISAAGAPPHSPGRAARPGLCHFYAALSPRCPQSGHLTIWLVGP